MEFIDAVPFLFFEEVECRAVRLNCCYFVVVVVDECDV